MKLTKRLTIGTDQRELISHNIVLELSTGGRGLIHVQGKAEKGQIIALDIGYNNQLVRYFTGYIEKATQAGRNITRLMVRELSGILAERYPVSIQHATYRQVITQLATDTGLSFVIPEQTNYTDTPIANFTSQGTGYQLLNNLLRAFNVPDGVWYQQQNGEIYIGSYQHCRWANKPVEIQGELSQSQANNSWQLVAMPAMRPGALVNNARVNKVELINDTMLITWSTNNTDTLQLQRQVKNAFPELAGGYHLPRLAKVIGISDSAAAGDINNPYRPRYAVDLQLQDEHGQPDTNVPIYKAIPLPVMFAGIEQGLMQYPLEGTIVELGFAYGRADQPFIRTILGTNFTLPTIAPGEQLQQQRAEVFQRTDTAGNQTRATDQTQTDSAYQKIIEADHHIANVGTMALNVKQHSTETIGSKKLIEALGAIELLAGDDISLGSLGNLHLTTAGEVIEVIGKLKHSVAAQLQKVEAPTHWAGTDTVNIYDLLNQLMQCVEQLADHCANHTHLYDKSNVGPVPTQKPDLTSNMASRSSDASELSSTLTPLLP